MKIVDNLKREGEQMMRSRDAELTGFRRWLRRAIDLGRFCWKRMKGENAAAMSAALSFRTIFALIPAIVLAGILLKPFGLVEQTKQGLDSFLSALGIEQIVVAKETSTAPGAAKAEMDEAPVEVLMLSEQIEKTVGSVEKKMTLGTVGPVGIVLLVWTVIVLLTTMERSLNRIWGAPRVRPLGKRMLLYWSVVTLCPLLLIAAVYLGELGVKGLENAPVLSWPVAAIEWIAPVLIGIVTLAILYKLMPNTMVRFGWVLAAAAVVTPAFLIAKWGFSLYVKHLVVHGSVYGALGLLPVFLVWVNLSWMLFIFGAVLAHTLENFRDLRAAESAEKFIESPSARVAAAVLVAAPYEAGRGPVSVREIAARLGLPVGAVERIMERLSAIRAVSRIEGPVPAYVLARPAAKIPMTEILEIDSHDHASQHDEFDAEIAAAIESFRGRAHGALAGWTLADFLAAPLSLSGRGSGLATP